MDLASAVVALFHKTTCFTSIQPQSNEENSWMKYETEITWVGNRYSIYDDNERMETHYHNLYNLANYKESVTWRGWNDSRNDNLGPISVFKFIPTPVFIKTMQKQWVTSQYLSLYCTIIKLFHYLLHMSHGIEIAFTKSAILSSKSIQFSCISTLTYKLTKQ